VCNSWNWACKIRKTCYKNSRLKLGSVEMRGIEPLTSALRTPRSPI
jgi:hypothetical protein